jgi:signal transduction histidine kinase
MVTGFVLIFAIPLSILTALVLTLAPLVLATPVRIGAVVLNKVFKLITRHPLFTPHRPLPPARLDRWRRRAVDPAGWLVFVLPVAWAMAGIERFLARTLAGTEIPSPYETDQPSTSDTLAAWYRNRSAQPPTWRDLAYVLLNIPFGFFWACTAYFLCIAPVVLASAIVFYLFSADAAGEIGEVIWIHSDTLAKAILVSAIGLIAIPVFAGPLQLAGRARCRIATWLLDVDPYLEANRLLVAEVTEQRTARAAAVRVADDEQLRIERDLHDGAQQRLVALALDLSRAKRKFTSDPEQAYALVDEAQQEAKRAIVELRNLARGIRPPILTDRGLDAAISALAGRASVPIEVDVRLPQRPPPPVESAAYFIVAEALTNVDKHAQASRAAVWVTRTGDRLVLEVRDDGRGGAAAAGRSGLAGLADRVASLDGSLQITSPAGGPTIIHAELPCES